MVGIKEDFKSVIAYSQGIEKPQVNALFALWYHAKQKWIDIFKGKLIYEFPEPVSFKLDADTKKRRFQQFLMDLENYDLIELARFLADCGEDSFYKNLTPEDIEFYGTNGKKVPKNAKMIKAFKYFISENDLLRHVQDRASMLVQEDRIEGTFCLSVHPLDFLSASENNHNWRSCHSLDGEYRAGNIAYMTDKCTIMCYIKSKDDEKLESFPDDVKWNSKKWRMFFYMDPEAKGVFAGRQYPFSSKQALDFTKDLVSSLTGEPFAAWTNAIVKDVIDSEGSPAFLDSNYIAWDGKLVPIETIIDPEASTLLFNDLLYSSCYDPYYAANLYKNNYILPHFHIGGPTVCLKCGDAEIEEGNRMLCKQCLEDEDYIYCYCCDKDLSHSPLYETVIDSSGRTRYICQECYNTNAHVCSVCGEPHFVFEMNYDIETDTHICENCQEEE